jgi:hypothetical protein
VLEGVVVAPGGAGAAALAASGHRCHSVCQSVSQSVPVVVVGRVYAGGV